VDTYLERSVVYVYMCTNIKMKLCSFIEFTLNINLDSVDDKKLERVIIFPTYL
jgi:hypothetical protein